MPEDGIQVRQLPPAHALTARDINRWPVSHQLEPSGLSQGVAYARGTVGCRYGWADIYDQVLLCSMTTPTCPSTA